MYGCVSLLMPVCAVYACFVCVYTCVFVCVVRYQIRVLVKYHIPCQTSVILSYFTTVFRWYFCVLIVHKLFEHGFLKNWLKFNNKMDPSNENYIVLRISLSNLLEIWRKLLNLSTQVSGICNGCCHLTHFYSKFCMTKKQCL